MAIELIDKIKPKNGGSFPMVDAADVQMGDGNRLSAFAEGVASKEYVHDYVQDFVPDVPEGAATEEYVQQYVNDFASDFLDTTLTASGKAAESAAVGQYFTQAMMTISGELAKKQPKGNYVKTVNGQTPDADGNVVVEGGGGGVTSWNDLTDKPFYEEASLVKIVAEQEYGGFTYLSSLGPYGTAKMNWFTLQEGEKYIVRWHGEDWPVTAYKAAQQGLEAVVLGNEKLMTGAGAAPVEPFVVYQVLGSNYCAVCAFDQNSSHEFGLFKDSTVIHPLDAKFLPSSVSIDLSQYESNGKIVETFADGTTKTTTVEFDGNGKPVKITDSFGNTTNLSW
jgi:hypothetical protein